MSANSNKSGKKALLEKCVSGLNLAEPVRLQHLISTEVSSSAIDSKASQQVQVESLSVSAAPALSTPNLTNTAQSGAAGDSVTPAQSQPMTLSARSDVDPFSESNQGTGPWRDPVSTQIGLAVTVSEGDSVMTRQSQHVTLSASQVRSNCQESEEEKSNSRRAPVILRQGVLKPRDHYCAVPNVLLNAVGLFESPYDFMVYLHLFSKSYGYGRNTCDMGLNELVLFTGLARNSVKKSLERLLAVRWIRMIQDFEYGRVTRKWRVYSPYERGETEHATFFDDSIANAHATSATAHCSARSIHDSVTERLCQEEILKESPRASVTGSPDDPYITKYKNNYIDLSLRACPEVRRYFSDLQPERKREREMEAYRSIRKNYSDNEIGSCVEYLLKNGLPGGDICHSPMAYLALSMREVLGIVKDSREVERKRSERELEKSIAAQKRADEDARERRESQIREVAFSRAFPDATRQSEVIAEICRNEKIPFKGEAGRLLAISAWWAGLNRYERSLALDEG